MKAYHGTSATNAKNILEYGFSLDYYRAISLGKGIYLSKDAKKCAEYGECILEVEIDERSILKDDFSSISKYIQQKQHDGSFEFHTKKFRDYTLSKGFKGLELNTFNEIVIYDLNCILSVSPYAVT